MLKKLNQALPDLQRQKKITAEVTEELASTKKRVEKETEQRKMADAELETLRAMRTTETFLPIIQQPMKWQDASHEEKTDFLSSKSIVPVEDTKSKPCCICCTSYSVNHSHVYNM